jgi:hypothetical protein
MMLMIRNSRLFTPSKKNCRDGFALLDCITSRSEARFPLERSLDLLFRHADSSVVSWIAKKIRFSARSGEMRIDYHV